MEQIQVRQRGTITIPKSLREKYDLEAGDSFMLVDMDGAFFLSPETSMVPKLVTKIEDLREEYDLPLEVLLEGVAEEREAYYRQQLEDDS